MEFDDLTAALEPPPPAETIEITLRLRLVPAGDRDEEPPGSWCRVCLVDVDEGGAAVKLAGRWMHEACARKRLDPAYPVDAWLAVAEHIASAPSRHSTATIRAALTALAAMVRDGGTAAPAAG